MRSATRLRSAPTPGPGRDWALVLRFNPPGETFSTISLQTVLPCPPPPSFLQHFSGKKNIFACSACVGAARPWGRGVRTEMGELEERIKTRPRNPVGFVPCVWYGGVKRPRTARRQLAGSAACSSLRNGN